MAMSRRDAMLSGLAVAGGSALTWRLIEAPSPLFTRRVTSQSQSTVRSVGGFVEYLDDAFTLTSVEGPDILKIVAGNWTGFPILGPFTVAGLAAIGIDLQLKGSAFLGLSVGWSRSVAFEPALGQTMLFSWPASAGLNATKIEDRFPFIAVPPGAKSAFLILVNRADEAIKRILSATVKGYRTRRMALPVEMFATPEGHGSCAKISRQEAPSGGRPIFSSGISLELAGIKQLEVLTRNQQYVDITSSRSYVAGSFAPKSWMAVEAGSEDTLDLTLGTCDLVAVRLDKQTSTVHLDAFDYHLAEHTLFGEGRLLPTTPEKFAGPAAGEYTRTNKNLGEREFDRRKSVTFSITRNGPALIPSWHPGGALATLILTDHADYHDLETETLLNFGKTQEGQNLGRGLVDRKFPHTKSLFLRGEPYPLTTKIFDVDSGTFSDQSIPFTQYSYLGTPDFRTLVDRIHGEAPGVEIGVHTAGTRNYSGAESEEALSRSAHLDLKVWIDHGMNEAMIMRSGWNPDSIQFYILKSLRQHDMKYAWAGGDMYRYPSQDGDLNMVRDNWPGPVLFEADVVNKSAPESASIRIFNTLKHVSFREMAENGLEKMMRDRALVITHSYLSIAFLDYAIDASGKRLVTWKPWAQALLDKFENQRQAGNLNISGLAKWADYAVAMRSLEIAQSDGGFKVYNPGHKIDGATFFVPARPSNKATAVSVTINGAPAMMRKTDDGILAWGNLKPGISEVSLK